MGEIVGGVKGFCFTSAVLFSCMLKGRLGLLRNRLRGLERLGCRGLVGRGDVSVEFSAAHHGEEDVEASACKRDDCGVVPLAFFAFSFIELPGTLVESNRCKGRLP